jgi:hypothetical protein
VVGYDPSSLCVIHKEDLCPSSGDINRLMMMMMTQTQRWMYLRWSGVWMRTRRGGCGRGSRSRRRRHLRAAVITPTAHPNIVPINHPMRMRRIHAHNCAFGKILNVFKSSFNGSLSERKVRVRSVRNVQRVRTRKSSRWIIIIYLKKSRDGKQNTRLSQTSNE